MLHDTSFSIAQATFSPFNKPPPVLGVLNTLPPVLLLLPPLTLHFSVPDFLPLPVAHWDAEPLGSVPPLVVHRADSALYSFDATETRLRGVIIETGSGWDAFFSSGACGAQRSHWVAKFHVFCFYLVLCVFFMPSILVPVLSQSYCKRLFSFISFSFLARSIEKMSLYSFLFLLKA